MGKPGRRERDPSQLSLVTDTDTIWRGRRVSVKERKRNAARAKEWRAKNPGRMEAKRDAWSAANPTPAKDRSAYYQQNRDKILARNKRNYLKRKAEGRLDPFAAKLRHKYGITRAEYEAMCLAQDNLCAICRRPNNTKNKKLVVDHCHQTGRVRGVLCDDCNQGIGRLGDSYANVLRAVEYLYDFEYKQGEKRHA